MNSELVLGQTGGESWLDTQELIAPVLFSNIANQDYYTGDQFILNGTLYKVTKVASTAGSPAIAQGDTIDIATDCVVADTVTEQINNTLEIQNVSVKYFRDNFVFRKRGCIVEVFTSSPLGGTGISSVPSGDLGTLTPSGYTLPKGFKPIGAVSMLPAWLEGKNAQVTLSIRPEGHITGYNYASSATTSLPKMNFFSATTYIASDD